MGSARPLTFSQLQILTTHLKPPTENCGFIWDSIFTFIVMVTWQPIEHTGGARQGGSKVWPVPAVSDEETVIELTDTYSSSKLEPEEESGQQVYVVHVPSSTSPSTLSILELSSSGRTGDYENYDSPLLLELLPYITPIISHPSLSCQLTVSLIEQTIRATVNCWSLYYSDGNIYRTFFQHFHVMLGLSPLLDCWQMWWLFVDSFKITSNKEH